MAEFLVRRALASDIPTIVRFTMQEALEAEGLAADPARVERGVRGAFDNAPRAVYWVAAAPKGELVASTSVVFEWSDVRGADYWWIQSFFVVPAHRGKGIAPMLIDHVERAAAAAGAMELRLYVHRSNTRAQRVYERHGFGPTPYAIMRKELRDVVAG